MFSVNSLNPSMYLSRGGIGCGGTSIGSSPNRILFSVLKIFFLIIKMQEHIGKANLTCVLFKVFVVGHHLMNESLEDKPSMVQWQFKVLDNIDGCVNASHELLVVIR